MHDPFVDIDYVARYCLVAMYLISVMFSAISVKDGLYTYQDLHVILLTVTQFLFVTAVPISIYHAWGHLTAFNKPKLQAQIIRIIWMVPVFCFEAYLSLQVVSYATYFQAMRELYEAYVIHCFMRLIMQYMCGDEDGHTAVVNRLATYPASMGAHKPPFCCLAPWQMGSEFVIKCKTGVFQYVVVRFFNSMLTMVLFTLGLYKEGSYAITQPFIWITAVNFVSQSWALYSLFLFFLCAHKELHGMRPFSKFVCIKLIIFFSWWQALLIGIMVRVGRINQGYGHSAQEIAVFIRATLISGEMVIAAVAFMYAFPASEFALPARSSSKKLGSKSSKRSGGASRGYLKLLSGSMHASKDNPHKSSTEHSRRGSALVDQPVTQPFSQKMLLQASKVLEYWSNSAKKSDATSGADNSPVAIARTKPAKRAAGSQQQQQFAWASKNAVPHGSCDSLVSLLASTRDKAQDSMEAGMRHESSLELPDKQICPPSMGREVIMPGVIRAMSSSGSEAEPSPLRPLQPHNTKRGAARGSAPEEECILAEDEEEAADPTGRRFRQLAATSPQRANAHYKRKGEASFEEPNLMMRASPGLTRTRRDSTPISPNNRHQPPAFRSKSFTDKTPLADNLGISGARRFADAGGLPTNRSLDQAFHSNYEMDQGELSDRASSECSTDSHTAPNMHLLGASALDLSSLSTRPKARGGGGKGRGGGGVSSLLQNLWISTLPADLQEDIGDLEAQLVELYCATVPTINFKRAIKGSIATS